MTMKRILLVCYYFPPLGGAGVGRPLSLYKYLPQYGYECDLLTVKPVAYRGFEPELLEGLDQSRIYRSRSWDPQRLLYLFGARKIKDTAISRGKTVADRFFPDPKIGWVRPATRLGRTLATNRRYEAVISTSPPMSSHLIAMKLAREYKLPWIADFRDYWTGYKAEDWFSNPRRIKRARKLLEKIVADATVVSVVNPAIAEYLGAGQVIYNSYDPERAKLWRSPTAADKLRIGILGTLDELRPVEPLFELLATVRDKSPAIFDKISLSQIGAINIPDFDALVDRYGLRDRITVHRTLGRIETIERLSECAMLYIGLSTSKETDIVPGRIFDMIASGRTLLAYTPPDSMIAALINETNHGHCFHDDNKSSAVEYLLSQYKLFAENKLVVEPLPGYARKFSAEGMAGQFAGLIEKVSGFS